MTHGVDDVGGLPLLHQEDDAAPTVGVGDEAGVLAALFDAGDVADADGAAVRVEAQDGVADLLRLLEAAPHDHLAAVGGALQHAAGAGDIAAAHRFDHVRHGDAVLPGAGRVHQHPHLRVRQADARHAGDQGQALQALLQRLGGCDQGGLRPGQHDFEHRDAAGNQPSEHRFVLHVRRKVRDGLYGGAQVDCRRINLGGAVVAVQFDGGERSVVGDDGAVFLDALHFVEGLFNGNGQLGLDILGRSPRQHSGQPEQGDFHVGNELSGQACRGQVAEHHHAAGDDVDEQMAADEEAQQTLQGRQTSSTTVTAAPSRRANWPSMTTSSFSDKPSSTSIKAPLLRPV